MQKYAKLSKNYPKKLKIAIFLGFLTCFTFFLTCFYHFACRDAKKCKKYPKVWKTIIFLEFLIWFFFPLIILLAGMQKYAKIIENLKIAIFLDFSTFFSCIFLKSFCLQGCKNMQKFSQKIENCNVPRVFFTFFKICLVILFLHFHLFFFNFHFFMF